MEDTHTPLIVGGITTIELPPLKPVTVPSAKSKTKPYSDQTAYNVTSSITWNISPGINSGKVPSGLVLHPRNANQ